MFRVLGIYSFDRYLKKHKWSKFLRNVNARYGKNSLVLKSRGKFEIPTFPVHTVPRLPNQNKQLIFIGSETSMILDAISKRLWSHFSNGES